MRRGKDSAIDILEGIVQADETEDPVAELKQETVWTSLTNPS